MLETDKQLLLSIESDLNFKGLVELIEVNDIKITFGPINFCLGLATQFGVYVDIKKTLKNCNPDILFFTILHEIAHYKKIRKGTFEELIDILANDNLESFTEEVINEEILADRYASFIYYKLNKRTFPNYWTQQLEKQYNQARYKTTAIPLLFGKIKNKEDYNKLVNELLATD